MSRLLLNFAHAYRGPTFIAALVTLSESDKYLTSGTPRHRYTQTNFEFTWTLEVHLRLIKNRFLDMCRPIKESYECGHDPLSLVHRCKEAVQANQRCEIPDSAESELRHKLACHQCRQLIHEGQKIFVRRNEKVWMVRRHFSKAPEKVDRSNCWERSHIPNCREMDSWICRMWR